MVPNNATIALVGDINPKEAIALIEQTFGKIPAAPPMPPLVTDEPEQRGERRVEIEFDAEPALAIGYHKPTFGHPDDDVFDVIDEVLTEGLTSRLQHSSCGRNGWPLGRVGCQLSGRAGAESLRHHSDSACPSYDSGSGNGDLRGVGTAEDGADFGQGIGEGAQQSGCRSGARPAIE